MYIEREDREKLKALSLEVFGVSSRWRKMLKRGKANQANDKAPKVMTPYTVETLVEDLEKLKKIKAEMQENALNFKI